MKKKNTDDICPYYSQCRKITIAIVTNNKTRCMTEVEQRMSWNSSRDKR